MRVTSITQLRDAPETIQASLPLAREVGRWGRGVRALFSALVLGGLVFLTAACGGGDGSAGKGPRITDPKLVATSTPIKDPLTFKIKNDVISVEGTSGTVKAGTPPATQPRSYTVKPGDTCAAIASEFGISVEQLRNANRSINTECSNLGAGEVLRIPVVATPTSSGGPSSGTPRAGTKEYKVVSGDTCQSIADKLKVDVKELIRINSLDAACTGLKIDQILRLP